MPSVLPAGPYKQITLENGETAPFYLIPFDKNGVCVAPQTRQHLIDGIQAGVFTDIFLFSHGWNNDFAIATTRYDHFLDGYQRMRKEHGLIYRRAVKPIFVGMIWPSTALVSEDEQPPAMAGAGAARGEYLDRLKAIADELKSDQVERFYELAGKDQLTEAEAKELADMLVPLYLAKSDEISSGEAALTAEDVLGIWKAVGMAGARSRPDMASHGDSGGGDFGFVEDNIVPVASPAAAGFLGLPSPRDVIRAFTVWQMKDRAGVVGSKGVGPLLDALLQKHGPKVHLIGHSYGAKIVLSALCYEPKSRPVNSVLLLQPAVSAFCFAQQVPKSSKPGGYAAAPGRTELPILSTFSKNDIPLTQIFHLALRRSEDIGELKIAGGTVPSPYAALGGFGPQGLSTGQVDMRMLSPGLSYDFGNLRVIGLNGDATIDGHGDVSNYSTWWALFCQVNA